MLTLPDDEGWGKCMQCGMGWGVPALREWGMRCRDMSWPRHWQQGPQGRQHPEPCPGVIVPPSWYARFAWPAAPPTRWLSEAECMARLRAWDDEEAELEPSA